MISTGTASTPLRAWGWQITDKTVALFTVSLMWGGRERKCSTVMAGMRIVPTCNLQGKRRKGGEKNINLQIKNASTLSTEKSYDSGMDKLMHPKKLSGSVWD